MSQRFHQQMPMQGPNQMPLQGNPMPMQSQGQQMPVYNQQLPVQGSMQQMPMQGPGMNIPMQSHHGQMPMQGQGSQMPVQGSGVQMQGTSHQMPMQNTTGQILMQGPVRQMPIQGGGHRMSMQSQQMPLGRGQVPVQMQGPRQQMPVHGPQISTYGSGQAVSSSQQGQFNQGRPQMVNPTMNMPGNWMPQYAPSASSQFGVRPPAYTPDMAKEFKTKQQIMQREQNKLIEKQRKKMEEEFKQRQFQETQKRLKEFSAIGGRKMDVDSAIHSIIGPTDSHPQGPRMTGPTHGVIQNHPPHETLSRSEAPTITQEDDFADFKSCPTVSSNPISTQNEPPAHKKMANNGGIASAEGNDAQTAEKKEGKKADLNSMMFECSDLTAPKQAKSFKTKTSVKDVQPNIKVASFQQSNRSRLWSGDTEQLTELFTQPEPAAKGASNPSPPAVTATSPPRISSAGVSPPSGVGTAAHSPGGPSVVQAGRSPAGQQRAKASLPNWLTGQVPVPDVYTMVLEACTRDGEIETGMLYPILLRSNLPKELLGHLWTLCNKQTPGRLVRQELFLLLAMVTVAQNKMDVSSLDILLHCAEAPVPDLGQHSQSVTPHLNTATGSQSSHITTTTPQAAKTTAVPNSTPSVVTSTEDDFADFKSAAAGNVKQQDNEDEFGDFKSTPVPTVASSLGSAPDLKPIHKVASDLIGEEDKYAALRASADDPGPNWDQAVSIEVHPIKGSNDSHFAADFGAFKDSSSTSDMLSFSSPTSSNQESVFSSEDSTTSSSSNQKSDDSHWGFHSSNQNKDLTQPDQYEDFGDFADFRNSSNTSFSSEMMNETPDKISALKALVSDKKMYTEKPKETSKTDDKTSVELSMNKVPVQSVDTINDNDDWDPFVKSGDSATTGFPAEEQSDIWASTTNGRGDVGGGNTEGLGVHNTMPETTQTTQNEEGWADFASATVDKTDEFGSFHTKAPRVAEFPKPTESKMKIDPKKANSLFVQNLSSKAGPGVGTGMSALDTEPPEFPDSPEYIDHDEDHGYNKFASFQEASGYDFDTQNGLSSLAAPYGGFDDQDETVKQELNVSSNVIGSAAANQKQLNNIQIGVMKTSQSASSFEFSGWNGQSKLGLEDSQSMKSLDLPVAGSQDGSPAGVDSQSVSSLDFTVNEGKKTAIDNKSVGSLDLKSEPQGSEPEGSEEGFGEFSGTTTLPEPVQPWTVGEAPINQADRYSELMGEPRESDRHLYCWDKCLSACVEILLQANNTFNAINSMSVCREVVESSRGKEYLEGITEIFRVGSRVRLAMHGLTLSSDHLEEHQKELHNLWNNLISFMANSPIMPSSQSLTFKKALIRKKDEDNLSDRLCGVCLLDADIYSDSEAANQESGHKLSYGGRHYHAPCANFWVNCVDSMLPALKIPELL